MPPLIGPDSPWLAPMAGHTDLPFRMLCREYGCTVACTEMVSVKGLLYNSPGTFRILETHPKDQPLVVQVFGRDKELIREALHVLLGMGFSYFDLNAGCPVKKVVKSGAGAALLQDPELLLDLVGTMVETVGPGRIGVKIRSGWYLGECMAIDLGPELENRGVSWITLHPRAVRQGFQGHADWSHLERLKRVVSVPVIGSGDLLTSDEAICCLNKTGIDGVMFARGALKCPMIFRNFLRKWSSTTDPRGQNIKELISVMQRHVQLTLKYDMSRSSFFKMRASLARYVRWIDEAKALRKRIMDCNDWQELESFLNIRQ